MYTRQLESLKKLHPRICWLRILRQEARALYNLMAAQGHSVGQPELRTTGAGVKVRRENGGRKNEVALFPNLEERWPSGFLFKVPLSHPSSVSSLCRFCQYLVNTLRPSSRFSRHVSLLCNVPESKGVRTERKPLFLFRLQTFFSREYAAENEIPYETPTCKPIKVIAFGDSHSLDPTYSPTRPQQGLRRVSSTSRCLSRMSSLTSPFPVTEPRLVQ